MQGNQPVKSGSWPSPARKIIEAAGIEKGANVVEYGGRAN
jgi:hypothetical protein